MNSQYPSSLSTEKGDPDQKDAERTEQKNLKFIIPTSPYLDRGPEWVLKGCDIFGSKWCSGKMPEEKVKVAIDYKRCDPRKCEKGICAALEVCPTKLNRQIEPYD